MFARPKSSKSKYQMIQKRSVNKHRQNIYTNLKMKVSYVVLMKAISDILKAVCIPVFTSNDVWTKPSIKNC